MAARAAVFLDRDGTVIHDRHYLADPAGVELLPTAGRAIARLNAAGLPVVLVTNQSGIGRGMYGEAEFRAVQARVEAVLAAEGARFDAVYYCPHAPGTGPPCDCRKPALGLFRQAARELELDLGASYYIGDRGRDVAPAAAFGGSPILLRPDATLEHDPDRPPPGTPVVATLEEAVLLVLAAVGAD